MKKTVNGKANTEIQQFQLNDQWISGLKKKKSVNHIIQPKDGNMKASLN